MDNALEIAHSAAIESGGTSHAGYFRADNQDSIRLAGAVDEPRTGWICALADGMGGYEHGKTASLLAVNAVYQAFAEPQPQKARGMANLLMLGVQAAHQAVLREASRLGAARMGTTLTAAALDGRRLHLAHVGDSRAYLVRGGEIRCLTSDHTVVGDLLRMKVIAESQVRGHDQRSTLTRAVGIQPEVQPELIEVELQEDDRLIFCSDGTWAVIEDEELAGLAASTSTMETVSQRIVQLALERDTDDNTSAIAVRFRKLPDKQPVFWRLARRLKAFWQNMDRREPALACRSGENGQPVRLPG